MPLVIVNEGVKINKEYYRSKIFGSCGTPLGSAALRQPAMDIPAGFCSGAQGENDSGVVQSPFSKFHLICGIATVFT
jgi:hypothetical protein